jgi:DNA topoisomerase-2
MASKLEYKELELHDHVLHRPDTYVGSVRNTRSTEFIGLIDDHKDIEIVQKEIEYIPAILRIFIEILSNAIDNKWRSDQAGIPTTAIKVTINKETGETSIWNDGLSIPIEINEQSQTWNPDMIFGRLLTSSNFNDTEERFSSGRNGLGASLTNIFSTMFKVTCVDPNTRQQYTQKWARNMKKRGEPKIKKTSVKRGSTEITWVPDFEYFGLQGYSDDVVALFVRYVCDTAMNTGVKVYLNGSKLPIKSLKQYASMYKSPTGEVLVLSEDVVLTSASEYQHISFVNGIYTSQGGIHVDLWAEAIFKTLAQKINQKYKQVKLTAKDVKQYFRLIIRVNVPNPEFSSQTKDRLISPRVNTNIESKHITALMKWSFMAYIREIIQNKELLTLKKTERKSRVTKQIDGYDPANNAGTKKSVYCTLILCEGLSAKTYAVTGIRKGIDFGSGLMKGRDVMGIYALRGKVLNTRNAKSTSIANNTEITGIIQALGLKYGVDYTDDRNFAMLSYGRVLCLCDSDNDGKHIESLLLNVFDSLFPSLLKRKGFFLSMQTPIMKLSYRSEKLIFYTQYDAYQYMEQFNDRTFKIKYYKGLGTSTETEVLETFGQRVIEYEYDSEAKHSINKVFNKDFADTRKKWMQDYDETEHVKYNPISKTLFTSTMSDFINCEMIKFSIDDCRRSIPHLMDGFKESNRKILFSCFLRNLSHDKEPMKVAQLAGYVAEKSDYHHGEQCLYDTITRMAQDYVGSNNIALLEKEGAFGSRLANGADAANARYIFTRLRKIARLIFHPDDDDILERYEDSGTPIEPKYYAPIIPMILVNGGMGIGTGHSCSIPSYNPKDIITQIHNWMDGRDVESINPWYNGFKGVIKQISSNKYESNGIVKTVGTKTTVTEIPIGISIDKYKDKLQESQDNKKIKNLKNYSTPDNPHFEFQEIQMIDLGLKSSISCSNMVLFDHTNHIRKFSSVRDILVSFCEQRMSLYEKRHEYLLSELKDKNRVLKDKLRFLRDVMSGDLNIQKVDEKELDIEMEEKGFQKVDGSFEFLLGMSMRSFSKQKLDHLMSQIEEYRSQIKELKRQTPKDLWKRDLVKLEKELYQ